MAPTPVAGRPVAGRHRCLMYKRGRHGLTAFSIAPQETRCLLMYRVGIGECNTSGSFGLFAMEGSFASGTVIDGQFEILSLVGSGGMGEVYKARQVDLDKTVALKILRATLVGESVALARFEREGKVLAGIDHPNIPQLLKFGVYNNRYPYLAMEFLEGSSLQELLDTKEIDWQRAVRIIIDACKALEFVHQLGFSHRDLKPNNIMVVRSGGQETVKVVDFGLAGMLGDGFSEVTRSGEVLGTILYMCPEQCIAGNADQRGDIYSAGCILYECLTGRPPFMSNSPLEVLQKHVAQKPEPVGRFIANFPAPFQQLVDRTLSKNPQDRPQSALELANCLEDMLTRFESVLFAPVSQIGVVSRRQANVSVLLCASAVIFVVCVAAAFQHLRVSSVSFDKPYDKPAGNDQKPLRSSHDNAGWRAIELARQALYNKEYQLTCRELESLLSNAKKADPEAVGLAHCMRAIACLRQKDYENANHESQVALRSRNKFVRATALVCMGELKIASGDFKAAFDDFKKAREMNLSTDSETSLSPKLIEALGVKPDAIDAVMIRSVSNAAFRERAMPMWRAAALRELMDKSALHCWVEALWRSGETQKAKALIMEGLERDSGDTSLFDHWVACLYAEKRSFAARAVVKKVADALEHEVNRLSGTGAGAANTNSTELIRPPSRTNSQLRKTLAIIYNGECARGNLDSAFKFCCLELPLCSTKHELDECFINIRDRAPPNSAIYKLCEEQLRSGAASSPAHQRSHQLQGSGRDGRASEQTSAVRGVESSVARGVESPAARGVESPAARDEEASAATREALAATVGGLASPSPAGDSVSRVQRLLLDGDAARARTIVERESKSATSPGERAKWTWLTGKVVYQEGNNARAIESFKKAILLNANEPQYFIDLISSLREACRSRESTELSQACIRRWPQNVQSLELGTLVPFSSFRAVWRKLAARVGPSCDDETRLDFIGCQIALLDEEALLQLSQVRDKRNPRFLHYLLKCKSFICRDYGWSDAFIENELKNAAANRSLLCALIRTGSDASAFPQLARNAARAYCVRYERTPEMAMLLSETPDVVSLCELDRLHVQAALLRKHDRKVERKILKRVVELAPRDARGWYRLGLANLSLNDISQAVSCFEQLKVLEPSWGDSFIARTLAQAGNIGETAACLNRAIKADPDCPVITSAAAVLLERCLQRRNFAGAENAFQVLCKTNPRNVRLLVSCLTWASLLKPHPDLVSLRSYHDLVNLMGSYSRMAPPKSSCEELLCGWTALQRQVVVELLIRLGKKTEAKLFCAEQIKDNELILRRVSVPADMWLNQGECFLICAEREKTRKVLSGAMQAALQGRPRAPDFWERFACIACEADDPKGVIYGTLACDPKLMRLHPDLFRIAFRAAIGLNDFSSAGRLARILGRKELESLTPEMVLAIKQKCQTDNQAKVESLVFELARICPDSVAALIFAADGSVPVQQLSKLVSRVLHDNPANVMCLKVRASLLYGEGEDELAQKVVLRLKQLHAAFPDNINGLSELTFSERLTPHEARIMNLILAEYRVR